MNTRDTLVSALMLVGLVASVEADTRVGIANASTTQLWSYLHTGTGETKITVSWTTPAIRVIMLLQCQTGTDSFTYGIAASGLDRYGEIVAGPPRNVRCLVGVSTVRGATSYRIHFTQGRAELSSGRGREPLSVDGLAWSTTQQMDRVRVSVEGSE